MGRGRTTGCALVGVVLLAGCGLPGGGLPVEQDSQLAGMSAQDALEAVQLNALKDGSGRAVLHLPVGATVEVASDVDDDREFVTTVDGRTVRVRVVDGRTYTAGLTGSPDGPVAVPGGRWVLDGQVPDVPGADLLLDGPQPQRYLGHLLGIDAVGDLPVDVVGPSTYEGRPTTLVDVGNGDQRRRVHVTPRGPAYPLAVLDADGSVVADSVEWGGVRIDAPPAEALVDVEGLKVRAAP